MAGKVVAVVGGQYGSEAKGLVVNQLAQQFGVHVRTGGPNAGHTIYHNGKPFVSRSIPCGWVNPQAQLIIGPGAVIDLDVLREEIAVLERAGYQVLHRLRIDHNAGIITRAQHHGEGGVAGFAHQNIGSTGEGVGLTRIARINRQSLLDTGDERYDFERARDSAELREICGEQWPTWDTLDLLDWYHERGENILLEGTQGSGLSLVHGHWPYCTSTDTNAGQLAVDAGISPSLISETILVCRTYPIRVAGNSGPLHGETTFAMLGVPEETTTVTKKVRRIGRWDNEMVRRAAVLNRPAKIVMTFMNYKFPDLQDLREWDDLTPEALSWLALIEESVGAPVVGASADPIHLAIRPGHLLYDR